MITGAPSFTWNDINYNRLIGAGIFVLAVLIGGWIVYRIGRTVIRRASFPGGVMREEAAARSETARALLLSVWKYVVLGAMGAALLSLVPSALVPTVALTSAVGLTIAFGAQWLFRDVIAGFSILMEGQFVVGDRIQIYGVDVEGVVEGIGLRTTVIRDDDGARVFVPNGSITAVRNLAGAEQAKPVARVARTRGGRGGRGRTRVARPDEAVTAADEVSATVAEPPRGTQPRPAAARAPRREPRRQPAAAEPGPATVFELPGEEAKAKVDGEGAETPERARRTRRGGRGRRRTTTRRPATRAANGEVKADESSKEKSAEPRDVLEDSPWSIE